jgi:hypothetical protein
MRFVVETDPVPLKVQVDGVVRVGGTRVTLETVVSACDEGATPEEILLQVPGASPHGHLRCHCVCTATPS